ncbi:hypothetical protein PSAN_47320 [Pseudomonas antarctica]|uniref:Uncharacterized protein n=1 Tax=Pseudomonas antarctica TaxID=219572 RepID=A0ABQ6ZQD5_9PSED|nr:hypothetical protein PSAN_47320 [Pseudomonas antarctica]
MRCPSYTSNNLGIGLAVNDTGPWPMATRSPSTMSASWLAQLGWDVPVLGFTPSVNYVKHHIPGARWALRAQLPEALAKVPAAERDVLTCASSSLARLAVADSRLANRVNL